MKMKAKKTNPWIELVKPKITALILVTTLLGYYLAPGAMDWSLKMLLTFLGTGLASSGASALNQFIEREADKQMVRTQNRPLPAGTITPLAALYFGLTLTLAGVFLLVLQVNLLSGFLALLSAFLYVLVYTPLKKISWWNTFVGSFPGALPTLIGWAAATGNVEHPGAWVLFLILFLWQFPHFFAIAWICREDYARAGFKMLPVVEPDGKSTGRQVVLYCTLLLPFSLFLTPLGLTGWIYFFGALGLGLYYLGMGVKMASTKTNPSARALLRASIYYFPALVGVIFIDAGF